MTKLEQLKQKHAALKQEIQDESKAFFKEACTEIFKKYPDIKEFSWTAYTPYFNDGDTCYFRVNSDANINEKGEWDEEPYIHKEAYKEISKLLNSIDRDTMEVMFGDHVKVIARPDAIEIEEYDHD